MKYIAVFLILNVLLLSTAVGKAAIHRGTSYCCISKTPKDCCRQQKKFADDDCGKGGCNAMLSCGTCGFVVTPSVSLSPVLIGLNLQTVYHFETGELSDYQDNDWNPPKA